MCVCICMYVYMYLDEEGGDLDASQGLLAVLLRQLRDAQREVGRRCLPVLNLRTTT